MQRDYVATFDECFGCGRKSALYGQPVSRKNDCKVIADQRRDTVFYNDVENLQLIQVAGKEHYLPGEMHE